MKVHSALGAGLLEVAYKVCLRRELKTWEFQVLSEVAIPIVDDSVSLDVGSEIIRVMNS